MKKKKLNLKELKLKRLVKELSQDQQNNTKGGYLRERSDWEAIDVRGKRFTEIATRTNNLDGLDLFNR